MGIVCLHGTNKMVHLSAMAYILAVYLDSKWDSREHKVNKAGRGSDLLA